MSDCIFCKIIKGSIPSSRIYENNSTYAFLDINPASKGHVLVIPKRHVEDLADITHEELTDLFQAINKISRALPKAIDNTGYNLLLNSGKDAGQIISHIHFHIIPRKKEDSLGFSNWPFLKFSGEHLNEIAGEITKNL